MNVLNFTSKPQILRPLFAAAVSALTVLGCVTAHAGPGLSGGNAGVVIQGRFYTLPEAGLKTVEEKDPITPTMIKATSKAVYAFMNNIEQFKVANKPSEFVGKMFGPDREYVQVSVVDAKLFAKIKTEYEPFVNKLGKGNFGLAAFTNGNTTYLLPEFFAASTTASTQARVLIHEQIYSMTWDEAKDRPGVSLKNLLRFDIALFNVMDFLPDGKCRFEWLRSGDYLYPQSHEYECGETMWKMAYALHKLALPGLEISKRETATQGLYIAANNLLARQEVIKLPFNREFTQDDLGGLISHLGREVYDVFSGVRLDTEHKDGNSWVQATSDNFTQLHHQGEGADYSIKIDDTSKASSFSCLDMHHARFCAR